MYAWFNILDALSAKINEYRHAQKRHGYQLVIIAHKSRLLVEFDAGICLNLTAEKYAPSKYGEYGFQKHLFRVVARLDNNEEIECARYLDDLPEVEFWVRNIASRPDTSFWLPTSEDRFYPDFVARLHDGRILVVEYKGAHLWDGQKAKRDIGEVWAELSNGRCLFVMPKGPDLAAIENAIAPQKKSPQSRINRQ